MTSTTEGMIYMTALRSLETVAVQFTPILNKSRRADYAELTVVGRNNPINHYTGGSDELTFELDFHATEENMEDVVQKVRMIESWAGNDGYNNPPEQIRLTFGQLFKENEVWLITQIATDFTLFHASRGMVPRQAYVQLNLKLDTNKNRRKSDIQWT